MFQKVKKELFYIRKMLRYRYSPLKFWRYSKNRYWGLKLLKKLPHLHYSPQDNFELHMLSQESDLWPGILGILSFVHYSGLNPRVIIHGGGSISQEISDVLEKKFNFIKVLRKEEADKKINKIDNVPDKVKKFREGKNKIIFKFIDVYLLSNADKIMVLDSDILFFKKPTEIIDFVNGPLSCDSIVSRDISIYPLSIDDEYDKKYSITQREGNRMNSGLILYNKKSFPLNKFIEYFSHTIKPEGYFVEMAGWSSLIVQTNFKFLSLEKYKMKGDIYDNVIAKHFTGPRRQQLYAYEIDNIRKKIGI